MKCLFDRVILGHCAQNNEYVVFLWAQSAATIFYLGTLLYNTLVFNILLRVENGARWSRKIIQQSQYNT